MSNVIEKFVNKCFKFRHIRMWAPDSIYIPWIWKKIKGTSLDIKHPTTLNEKIQWLKLHDRKKIYTTLVDKIAVKSWISNKFGAEYVIPTIATYSQFEDIELSQLPNKFILKCNHDSGTYVICRDKESFNLGEYKEKFTRALKNNFYYPYREWPYKHIQPQILCEELLELKKGNIPNDYKLHYINGKLEFVYVSFDRRGINDRCTFDENWNRLPFVWVPYDSYRVNMNTSNVPCPPTFEKMKKFGAEIAKMFKYVRVDFYDVDGKLYFGEITLYHGSGYDTFFPEEYDKIYGDKLKLK